MKKMLFNLNVAPLDSNIERWCINGDGPLTEGGRVLTMQLVNNLCGWRGPSNDGMLTLGEQKRWSTTISIRKQFYFMRSIMFDAFKYMCSSGNQNTV